MKSLYTIALAFSLLFSQFATAQHTGASALHNQFLTEYNTLLKTHYNTERQTLQLSPGLAEEISALRQYYTLTLAQMKTQDPSLEALSKQYYRIYPDINAVFFNRDSQFVSNLDEEKKQTLNARLVQIWKTIPNPLYNKAVHASDRLQREKFQLVVPYNFSLFQSYFDNSQRKRDYVINFLLYLP